MDAKCQRLTAPWVRARAARLQHEQRHHGEDGGSGGDDDGGGGDAADIETCDWFEGLDAAGPEGRLDAGVYTLHELRAVGRKKRWCPYFLARHMVAYANVVVWNYQYLLDPKVRCMCVVWGRGGGLKGWGRV